MQNSTRWTILWRAHVVTSGGAAIPAVAASFPVNSWEPSVAAAAVEGTDDVTDVPLPGNREVVLARVSSGGDGETSTARAETLKLRVDRHQGMTAHALLIAVPPDASVARPWALAAQSALVERFASDSLGPRQPTLVGHRADTGRLLRARLRCMRVRTREAR